MTDKHSNLGLYNEAVKDNKIGARIKYEREQMNLTQESLSDMLNISKQSISSWENSKAFPSIDNYIQLSDIFHCSIEYLLCLTDKREHSSYDNAYHLGLTPEACHKLEILTKFADSYIPYSETTDEQFEQSVHSGHIPLDCVSPELFFLMFINRIITAEFETGQLIIKLFELYNTYYANNTNTASHSVKFRVEREFAISSEIIQLIEGLNPTDKFFIDYIALSLKRSDKKEDNLFKETPSERDPIYNDGDIVSRIIKPDSKNPEQSNLHQYTGSREPSEEQKHQRKDSKQAPNAEQILQAIHNSGKSLQEIMAFLED